MTMKPQVTPTENNRDSAFHTNIRRCALEVVEGPDRGAKLYPLPEYTLIGRSPSCDLVLTDVQASALHCALKITSKRVILKDLASTNGTRCGDMRIVEVYLEPEMVFTIGSTKLRIEVHSGSEKVLRMPCDSTGNLIGSVPAMQELFALMAHLAPHPIPVVILGETGTGKTLVARALHQMSPRSKGPFVSVNCATLQPELVESTLFGHEKGAFTNAYKRHSGVFEQANEGTLLLDEIGELPEAVQPKLLQVLETGLVRPVGADREMSVDVRLLTATNRPLALESRDGRFRQDLYFRIAGMELVLPPLWERLQDIPILANHFISQIVIKQFRERAERVQAKSLSPTAMHKLMSHPWPGNVRELYFTLDRAFVLAQGQTIEPEHIAFLGWLSLEKERATFSATPIPRSLAPEGPSLDGTFKDFKTSLIEANEQIYLEHLMKRAEDNQVRAAKIAGISRSYLRTLLQKYGMLD
jgi:DNA-binding NtrC family response regulator